jgi:hypothetical protein
MCATHRGYVEFTLQARSDPRVEIWDAERKSGLFQRAFSLEPRFVWVHGLERRGGAGSHRLKLAAAG